MVQSTVVSAPPALINKNESPFPPLPAVVRMMRRMAAELNRYGDFKPMLPAAIAARLAVPAECVITGNGSSDVLFTLARAILRSGDAVAVPEYSFIVYDVAAQSVGGRVVKTPAQGLAHDLGALLRAARDGARMVIICTPNNPTSTVIGKTELQDFIDAAPASTILLIDEAYGEFLEPRSRLDTVHLACERRNVVTLRTFSKLHGLAGLRVGYAVGHPELIAPIARSQPAFHLSILAQMAAAESLRHPRQLEERRRYFAAERTRIVQALERLEIPFVPPAASFYMVDLGGTAEASVAELARRGVMVQGTRIGSYIRPSIGAPEENDAFLRAAAAMIGRTAPV